MKKAIFLIIALYLLIGTIHAILNPLWEAPDEIHHFAMVQYLASHALQLPSQELGTVGLWQQEGNQPPLYYLIGAILISPIDSSDIDTVMRVNPHADIGIIRPDGNINRVVHHPSREVFPASGAVLATYLLRFYSLLLGAGTIYFTSRLARLLFPEMPMGAILAAGLNAFIPMFVYISAAVNNDNLSNFLATWLIYLLASFLLGEEKGTWRFFSLLGILVGCALLSKLSLGLIIPLVGISLAIVAWRERDWKIFAYGSVISGSLTILIAAWWYWRNWELFGDVTGLERFLAIVGTRIEPASLQQLWTETEGFFRTFWGLFGSINLPMPDIFYQFSNLVGALAFIGGLLTFAVEMRNQKERRLGLGLVLLWIALIFVALLRWTSITPASQGRLMYAAIGMICLLMAVGILYWLPKIMRLGTGIVLIGTMSLISLLIPIFLINPAYKVSAIELGENHLAEFVSGDGAIHLIDFTIPDEAVFAGEYLEFSVDFAIEQESSINWSIFVHLLSPEGIILAQRDIYPAGGLMATSDYEADFAWENLFALSLSPTTYAPTTAEIRLGFYDTQTGERMLLENGSNYFVLGNVEILPREFSINFGGELELIDYALSDISVEAGDSIELTLFWRGLVPIENDYVVFVNVIDAESLEKFADSNAMPANWTRPSSTWQVGEIIEDRHILTVRDNAPSGVFTLELGLYIQQENRFIRLPLLGTYEDKLILTPIRIGN